MKASGLRLPTMPWIDYVSYVVSFSVERNLSGES